MLVVPIATRIMTLDAFSEMAYLYNIYAILLVVLSANAPSAYFRLGYKINRSELKTFVFWLMMSVALLYMLIIVVIDIFFSEIKNYFGLIVVGVTAVLYTLFRLYQIDRQVEKKSIQFVLYQLGPIASVLLMLLTIGSLFPDWEYVRQFGICVFCAMVVLLNRIDKNIRFIKQVRYLKAEFFKFVLPLYPYALLAALLGFIDKYYVETLGGNFDFSIYTVAFSLSATFMYVVDGLNKYWNVVYIERAEAGFSEAKLMILKAGLLFPVSVIFLLFAYYFNVEIVLAYAGKDYLAAADLVFILCVGQVGAGFWTVVGMRTTYRMENSHFSYAAAIALAVFVISMEVFVEEYSLLTIACLIAVAMWLKTIALTAISLINSILVKKNHCRRGDL